MTKRITIYNTKRDSAPIDGQYTNFILFDVAL